jgi:hypothetical protein
MTDKQPQQGGTLVPYEAKLPRPFVPGDEYNPRDYFVAEQIRSILAAAHEHYAAQVAAMVQPQGDAAMPVAAHKVIGPRGDLIGIFENGTIAAMMVSKNSAEVGPTSSRRLVDEADAQAAIAARDAQIAELEGVIKSAEEGGDLLQKDVEARDAEIERLRSALRGNQVSMLDGVYAKNYKLDSTWLCIQFSNQQDAVAARVAIRSLDERLPAPEAAQPAVPRPLWEQAYTVLQFYANEASYRGARTGGVLAGCPREPAPTAADMTEQARMLLAQIDRAQPADIEAQVQEVMRRVDSACHAWAAWCENATRADGTIFDREKGAIDSAIRRLVGGK